MELVKEKLPAGKHQRILHGGKLLPGSYLYRLTVGDKQITKKLAIIQ
jgi:hypothetical protein